MASPPAIIRQKISFPNLDGLRFFCFGAVFLFHAFHTDSTEVAGSAAYQMVRWIFRHGNMGVNFFFVLSGFLITCLLLDEKKHCGRIHVGYFYIRRMLRIWPLYAACVAFGFLAFPTLKRLAGLEPNETANPLMYLLFLSNFDVIENGLPDAGVLGVLWSVGVEEQFYLAWPLLLAVVPLGRELWVLLAVLASSLAFRWIHTEYVMLTFHTLGLIGDMTVGGLAAYAAVNSRRFVDALEQAPAGAIQGLYALCGAVLLADIGFLRPFDRLVPALIFALIILEQNYSRNSPFKVGRVGLLTHLGQRTYGMYCLHMVGNVAALQLARMSRQTEGLWQVLLLVPMVAFAITILLSEASYAFFERPFLRLKLRYQFISRE